MSATLRLDRAALLIVDVQKAIDDPSWGGDRNNRGAERNIALLLSGWRRLGWPLFHVRHLSRDPLSTYRPGQPGAEFKAEAAPLPGERVIDKQTNSAFIGTPLEEELRAAGVRQVVITGVITNNSVEATARMSGNLGFETFVVADATATFGRLDYDGCWRTADEVQAMSLANLSGEYATILGTEEVLERFAPPPLESERLRLRPMAAGDAPFIVRLLNDPAFIANIGDRNVRTAEEAIRYIENGPQASYARHGLGLLLVETREGGEPVGICGLIKRDTLEDVDVGYALAPEFRARGFAVEAAGAAMRFGTDVLGLRRVVAIVSPGNDGSVRVLEKLGFRFEKMVRMPGESIDLQLFAFSAPPAAPTRP